MITKADIVLAVVLLVVGLCSPFFLRTAQGEASRVVITVDGEQLGSFDLSEDRTLALIGSNRATQVGMHPRYGHHQQGSKESEILCAP